MNDSFTKAARLAAILFLLYVAVPATILGFSFSRPDVLNTDTLFQFFMAVMLFGIIPHAPACLVLFLMMITKGMQGLAGLSHYKGVMFAALLVLAVHWGMAILTALNPVEFGMLVNFFLVPLLGAVSIGLGTIIGRMV